MGEGERECVGERVRKRESVRTFELRNVFSSNYLFSVWSSFWCVFSCLCCVFNFFLFAIFVCIVFFFVSERISKSISTKMCLFLSLFVSTSSSKPYPSVGVYMSVLCSTKLNCIQHLYPYKYACKQSNFSNICYV